MPERWKSCRIEDVVGRHADQLRKSAAWFAASAGSVGRSDRTMCASFAQEEVPLIRKGQVYAWIRKEMGIVFLVLSE
jgi:hypothetical protein